MKKTLFLLVAFCLGLDLYPQTTSLTIDNQIPGMLSTKIDDSTQKTLKNLKVTGYINAYDIQFIKYLNSFSLSGVLDLEDVNIVSGGEYSYYGIPYTTTNNTISGRMFANFKPIQKVILPKTIKYWDGGYAFESSTVDTLIINGNMKKIVIGKYTSNYYWRVRTVYIPEGTENLYFRGFFRLDIENQEMFLPSTLKEVNGNNADETTVFHCSSLRPDSIIEVYPTGQTQSSLKNGTMYVPKGTKELYEKSIFRNLNIIEDIHVDGISIDDSKLLYAGDKTRLEAKIIPDDAINKSVKWESSNEDVACISDDGVLTANAFGTTEITATTIDGGFKANCKVQVYEHTIGVQMIDNLSIYVGSQGDLKAQTLPLSTTDGKIEYYSNNNNIVNVSETGIIAAKSKGTCTITATSVDGGYTAECLVTVLQPVEAVKMEKHRFSMKVGESDYLHAQIVPETADHKTLIWSSSDEQIATVVGNGNVVGLKAGTVWIMVVSEDNSEAKDSCKVTILQPVTGITLNSSSYQMEGIGSSVELEASIIPEDASNKNIKWKSSDETVCVVSNGVVVAVGAGTCVIIATSEDGGFMATCTIIVTIPSDISSVQKTNGQSYQIFDLNGIKRTFFQKGINIIRFDDGTIKKIQIRN